MEKENLVQIVGDSLILNGKTIYSNEDLNEDERITQNKKYIVWSESWFTSDFWGDGRYHVVRINALDRKSGNIKKVFKWSDGESRYQSYIERYLNKLELENNELHIHYNEYEGDRLEELIDLDEIFKE